MRQKYETDDLLLLEKNVSNKIVELVNKNSPTLLYSYPFLRNTQIQKLPTLTYKIDWCFVDQSNNITAWAELKRRNIKINQYPDIMISAHKLASGRQLSVSTGVPFMVFIEFLDGIGFHMVMKHNNYVLKYGGRTSNTRDVGDIEPVCYINTKDFVFLD